MHLRRFSVVVLLLANAIVVDGADAFWKAGVARANITPPEGLWMAGYASRDKPADGKVTDLWLKALALEDAHGHRAVIVTSDLLGIPQNIYQHTCKALKEKLALEPEQILLGVSHTHCSPVLRGALYDVYPLDEKQLAMIEKYSAELEIKLVETVGRAFADLAPAQLAAAEGTTGFAVNRRNNAEPNVPKLISEGALKGPVDHSVPVLAVSQPDGKLKALLFGYACHNTVMNFNKWCGDYAGFAQIALEKSHPACTAMFFIGCGADQNPLPRRQLELAERYGNMLAAAVEEALLKPARQLPAELKMSVEMVTLNLGLVPTEAELKTMQAGKAATDRRWATRLLGEMKQGKQFIRTYPYPLQVWNFGNSQLLFAMGGEVVVDYALKLKQEFGAQTWVAGYCNDVMTYIPSTRVLKEGGYEGGGAMTVYGLPALRWSDDVEESILTSARQQVQRIRKSSE